MDRSRALNALAEAVELTRMVEELIAPSQGDKLAQTVGGIRVTLRNVRESILGAHDVLARELVQASRARSASSENDSQSISLRGKELEGATSRSVMLDNSSVISNNGQRRDLRSNLDRSNA